MPGKPAPAILNRPVWTAIRSKLSKPAGPKSTWTPRWRNWRNSGSKPITYHDAEYPARLKEIYDYPPLIYVKGELTPQDEWCIAVVGTRRATVYGRQVTEEIVADLAQNKITVVSGLARGIDTVAHRRTLEAGGRTIAIFACGLDTIYPGENANLARSIINQGALISEYPLGAKPRPDNFPAAQPDYERYEPGSAGH